MSGLSTKKGKESDDPWSCQTKEKRYWDMKPFLKIINGGIIEEVFCDVLGSVMIVQGVNGSASESAIIETSCLFIRCEYH